MGARLVSKNVFEKYKMYLNFKSKSLPKFVDHMIQTPHFRIVSHIDGSFYIEKKLKNQKQYSVVSIQSLFSQYFSIDISLANILNLIFSTKHFITFILNQDNEIFIIFQLGQIAICGKTGKIQMGFQSNILCPLSFISEISKTYFMAFLEKSNNIIFYHIASAEIFCFQCIFGNPNSKLDYDFLKNNKKKSFELVDSQNCLFNQMVTHIYKIKCDEILKTPNGFNEILNAIDNFEI